MAKKKLLGLVAVLLTLSLLGAACTNNAGTEAAADTTTEVPTADNASADLRSGLTALLGEHVYLAALATGSALRGDTAGFNAWAAALNGETNSNSADIVAAVRSAYGDDVGEAFNGLWRSRDHIDGFVRYTQAIAKDDRRAADQAVADLTGYARSFGETMTQVNENLPAAAVEEGITMHATTLIAVIDAQKAGNQQAVYSSLREAYHHMDELAKTLAGRTPQFEAAAAALNGETASNSADIVGAIRSVYGDDVGDAFNGLWRSRDHIDGFVRYTQAVAKDDRRAAEQAVTDLTGYAKSFGETMNQVNENLPAAAVEQEITGHATSLIAVIDAQKANDAAGAATGLREAAHHMSNTAKVLAEATVARFPEKF